MTECNYSTYLRVRDRRLSRTIIYSCVAGAPVCGIGSVVHGFLIGSVVAIAVLYYRAKKLERYREVSQIGG